jgi:hypothetical protein
LVGSAPYQKPCNACGKQIILGIDKESGKWRPWDNYATGDKHNCSAKAVTSEKISTMATAGTGAAKSEEVAVVLARVTELQNDVKLLFYVAEKIAKKVGVELNESNESHG